MTIVLSKVTKVNKSYLQLFLRHAVVAALLVVHGAIDNLFFRLDFLIGHLFIRVLKLNVPSPLLGGVMETYVDVPSPHLGGVVETYVDVPSPHLGGVVETYVDVPSPHLGGVVETYVLKELARLPWYYINRMVD